MAAQQGQTSQTVVQQDASGQQVPQTGGPQMLIMFAVIFAIFYFIIILPAKKKQKKHATMVDALKGGERVVTAGGIYGKVLRVMEDRIELEIDKNSKMQIAKASISTIIPLEGKEQASDKK
jgi:preprotein translocase subunit YajC